MMKKILVALAIILVLVVINKFIYVLPFHVGAFFITLIAVVVADLQALLWVLGKLPTLDKKQIHRLHSMVEVGLLVIVTTGILLALPVADYLVTITAFLLKMTFVFALIINSFVIKRHMDIPTTRTFASLTTGEKIPLLVSGLVSSASWIGAFICAQFLGL
jgi:hypothetical protein